jgi:hypothetical protein
MARPDRAIEPCPKCGGPSRAKSCGADCLHCDSETCEHAWFPGQSDTSPASYKWFVRSLRNGERPFTPNTGNEGQAIRRIAVTILIDSDAECIDIAKSVRKILDDADCFTYQLGVAPVVQS